MDHLFGKNLLSIILNTYKIWAKKKKNETYYITTQYECKYQGIKHWIVLVFSSERYIRFAYWDIDGWTPNTTAMSAHNSWPISLGNLFRQINLLHQRSSLPYYSEHQFYSTLHYTTRPHFRLYVLFFYLIRYSAKMYN